MISAQSIYAVWKAGSEPDAWILHRSLIDRLLHLHYLGARNGFVDFDDFSFSAIYKARHELLSDSDMKAKVPASLRDLQKANRARYNLVMARRPKWRRPRAEDVAKEMGLGFVYKFGYDYASMHVHPMSSDGETDFQALITPVHKRPDPDSTVVKNSVLVQSLLVQEALNISKMHWRAIVYDFLDQIRKFVVTGDQTFQVTMYKLAQAGPEFKLCAAPSPTDKA